MQKIKDGEPLRARLSTASAFGDNTGVYGNMQPANKPNYPGQTIQIDPITGAPVNGGVLGI